MNIIPIPAFTDNYIWVLIDKNNAVFDCIDPGTAEPVLDFARQHQIKLRALLLTHHHPDHIGGVKQLVESYPTCLVYGPTDPRIPEVTHPVHKDQQVQIGSNSFQILFNPGHTSTHISYYEANKNWLFCGDTLFSGGCGRVFDGTIEQLHQSLLMFKKLPTKTQVFCAHEYTQQNLKFAHVVEPGNKTITQYSDKLTKENGCSLPSTIQQELEINPFLRTENHEVQSYVLEHGAQSTTSLEVFRILREQKNKF